MKKIIIKYKPGCAGEPIALIIERIRNGEAPPDTDPLNRYNNGTPRVPNLAYRNAAAHGIYDSFIAYDNPESGVVLAHALWLSTIANLYKKGFAFLYEIVDNTNIDCKKLFTAKVAQGKSMEGFFESAEKMVGDGFYSNKMVTTYERQAFECKTYTYQEIFESSDGYKVIEEMGDVKLNDEWIEWYNQYCVRNREIISEWAI